MNITYFRVYQDEDLNRDTIIEISDRLENCKFMAKQYSKNYYINLSVDNGKNFFSVTNRKGLPLVFSDRFISVLDLFFSHMDEYSHLTTNINEAFEIVMENLKYGEKK